MNFPEKLDKEDMKLAMKEWRLSGLEVVTGPWEPSDGRILNQVAVGRQRELGMGWYWAVRYDLEGKWWRKKMEHAVP